MYGHFYTEDEIEFLLKKRPYVTKDKLAEMFNSKFNTNIPAKALQQVCARRCVYSLDNGCFKKGHIPPNKGKKQSEFMTEEQIERSSTTRFKKGHIPFNHRPVGSVRVTKNGYVEIKVAEPNKWRPKHHCLWEKINGDIPKGYHLTFADGNRLNINIDNLVLVSNRQSLTLHRQNLKYKNRETLDCCLKVADIQNKITDLKKNNKGVR